MPHAWSSYQRAIFSATQESSDSLSINAVAGSGKTTTIIEAAGGQECLFLAFNKSIATNLANHGLDASTFNALGHRAWAKAIGKGLTLNTSKLYGIVKDLEVPSDMFTDVLNLTRFAKIAGIVPSDTVGSYTSLLCDEPEVWADLADERDLEFGPEILRFARRALAMSIAQARSGIIDFQDQIYHTALFGAPLARRSLVFVDEAQDLDPLQHRILSRLTDRLISVGDPNQACYGFRGAEAQSMQHLAKRFGARDLPLSISYRCPRSVVREAQQYVPRMESWGDAPAGIVDKTSEVLSAIHPGTHILCRYNAPIFKLAWQLITSGTPANILGKDISVGLRRLIRRIAPESIPMAEFLPRLHAWAANEIANKPRKEAQVTDRVSTLTAIPAATSGELIADIERLFRGAGIVTLSSIHRAKGLEWPHVVFYGPELLPSKYAKTDMQLEQEANLAYIAITRAKERLTYAEITA